MNNNIPSISDSFNAKTTSTEELCATFITNDFLEQLACPNHCIMIGPRGSGKTTLMRMLEVESLELWSGEDSEHYRSQVCFSGVFIPTDRYWKSQYDKIEESRLNIDLSSSDAFKFEKSLDILDVIFTFHVLEQFLSTVNYRSSRTINKKNKFRTVNLSKEDEVELVNALSEIWGLTPTINTLRSLFSAIVIKKQKLAILVNEVIKGKDIETEPFPSLIDTIKSSVSIVNNIFDEKNGKWCFLFDELELAPNKIIQPLVDQMRGGHKDIILKLALSPYHNGVSITENTDSSMKSEDLRYINLTGLGDAEGQKFAKQLCTALFKRKGLMNNVESYFKSPKPIDINRDFIELIEKDPSFKIHLGERNLLKMEYDESDSLIRKIKFIVHLRNYKRDKNQQQKRRRRPADYYGGFKHICKSVEYNPRMIIGLMNNFIPIAKEGTIEISTQIKQIENYYESFKALLSTIAVESTNSKLNNIHDFINEIATYFSNEIHGQEFKPEPKGAFKIKSDVPNELQEIVGYALNSGALIIVEEKRDNASNNFGTNTVKTCRLSYLFSHNYDLLMTKQKDIDLNLLVNATEINRSNLNLVKLLRSDPKQINLEFN